MKDPNSVQTSSKGILDFFFGILGFCFGFMDLFWDFLGSFYKSQSVNALRLYSQILESCLSKTIPYIISATSLNINSQWPYW